MKRDWFILGALFVICAISLAGCQDAQLGASGDPQSRPVAMNSTDASNPGDAATVESDSTTRSSPAAPQAATDSPSTADIADKTEDADSVKGAEETSAAPAASDPASTPAVTAPPATAPRTAPRRPIRRKPGQAADINFDDIKFEMEKTEPFVRSMLTKQIEELNDTPIKIRGYMLPSFQQRGIKQFVLVRDNQECCFGPGAALYDCIVVEMTGGSTAEYSLYPVAVEGVFSVRELVGADGKHLAIYHLDAKSVK